VNLYPDISAIWTLLGRTSRLEIRAELSQSERLETRVGAAAVFVSHPSQDTLYFHEKGEWILPEPRLAFTNILRWSMDVASSEIALEHLRQGADRPVFLFKLRPAAPFVLQSVAPHRCGEDCYTAEFHWRGNEIEWVCSIAGPRKTIRLTYRYF